MVLSRLTQVVNYYEDNIIHSEDFGHESSLYNIELFKQTVTITLGKVKFTYVSKGVLYFPLYLVTHNNKFYQIGVYEMASNNMEQMMGDIDLSLLSDPLLFSNAKQVIEESDRKSQVVNKKGKVIHDKNQEKKQEKEQEKNQEKKQEKKQEKEQEKNQEKNQESVRELGIDELHITDIDKDIQKTLKCGIFTKHNREKTSLLPDELKETAEQMTLTFHQSSKDNWITHLMKNSHYELKDVEEDSSFFTVVKDAFEQVGYYTTIKKLRSVIAMNTTENYLVEQRILYSEYKAQLFKMKKMMVDIKKTIEIDLRGKIQNSIITKVEQKKILDECNTLKDEFDRINKLKNETIKKMDDTFGKQFDEIDSLEKYKEFIMSNKYIINSNAVSIIERELNVIIITFSEMDKLDQNEVIQSESHTPGKIIYKPDFYILCSMKNGRYKKVSYKCKNILEFPEIPYHVKIMIIKKMISGISGKFASIEHFKNYASYIGIKEFNNIIRDNRDDNHMEELYDPKLKLMFYSKSSDKPPGTGCGDSIDTSNVHLMSELSFMNNWRKKLDDTWIDLENPFVVNNKKYASVVHYYQGSKFKNGFPDFSEQFSLDSGSKISSDLIMCNGASSSNGTININNNVIVLRPKHIQVDPDFYKGRNLVERQRAIDAKFSQNPLLREILIKTIPAKLNHYIGNKVPEIAIELMRTRKNLR
jgi:hypothetical protein